MRILMITTDWPSTFMGRQVEHLRKTGADIEVFHFYGGKNPVNYMRAWMRVRRRMKSKTFDLIHAQFGQSAFPALPKKLPLVVTFRGSDVQGIVNAAGKYTWHGWLLRAFSYFAAWAADEAVVVAEAMIKNLPKRRYHIIPSGLDLEMFQPIEQSVARQKLNLPPDKKIIFFGGSPNAPEKRYPLACAAAKLLEKDFNLQMIPAQNIPYSDMPYYLNASDVLLLVSTHEGSSNVVKEALACNVPVVGTDVGDMRQRIGNIEGCLVCVDDSPQSIARALKQVLVRGGKIAGRETVRALDENALAQEMLRVYQLAVDQWKK